ncbi:MAG: hypothetical protein ACYCQI_10650 [Gammaproteobacteria bacterium]
MSTARILGEVMTDPANQVSEVKLSEAYKYILDQAELLAQPVNEIPKPNFDAMMKSLQEDIERLNERIANLPKESAEDKRNAEDTRNKLQSLQKDLQVQRNIPTLKEAKGISADTHSTRDRYRLAAGKVAAPKAAAKLAAIVAPPPAIPGGAPPVEKILSEAKKAKAAKAAAAIDRAAEERGKKLLSTQFHAATGYNESADRKRAPTGVEGGAAGRSAQITVHMFRFQDAGILDSNRDLDHPDTKLTEAEITMLANKLNAMLSKEEKHSRELTWFSAGEPTHQLTCFLPKDAVDRVNVYIDKLRAEFDILIRERQSPDFGSRSI